MSSSGDTTERWLDLPPNAKYHLCKVFILLSFFFYGIAYGVELEIHYNLIKLNLDEGFEYKAMIYVTLLIGIIYPLWSVQTKQSNIMFIIVMPILAGIATGVILIVVLSVTLSLQIDKQMAGTSQIVPLLQTAPIMFALLFNIYMFMSWITAQRMLYYLGSFVLFISMVIIKPSPSFVIHFGVNVAFFLLTLAPTQSLLYPLAKFNENSSACSTDKDSVVDAMNFLIDMAFNKTNNEYWKTLSQT